MLWQGRRESDNVEDDRGAGGGGGGGFGGGRIAGVGGVGGVILVILYLVLGGDPQALIDQSQRSGPANATSAHRSGPPANDEMSHFVRVVLADTEDVWHAQFRAMGREYQEPKLVLFTDQ